MLTIRISIPVLTLVQRGTVFLLVFFFFKPHIFKQHPLLPDHAHLFLHLPTLFAGVDEQQGQ